MSVWNKLTTDPEAGTRIRSPLAFGALGLGLSFFFLHTLITGAVRTSKAGDGAYIHFADHPKIFVLICIMALVGAVWAFANARNQYLMNDKEHYEN